MNEKEYLTAQLKKARDIFHQQGAFVTLLLFLGKILRKANIVFNPFYYMKETLNSDIPSKLTTLPEGFEFSIFNLKDIDAISKHPERKGYAETQYVIKNFNKGDTCLGIKHQGEIVGFAWFSIRENRTRLYPALMKKNEAYLYDMFILNAFRGHNLAPSLRYKNYEILKRLGRDTFYSITECSNTASFRFKQKLGSKIVFWGLYIDIFKRWHKTFTLKKY